MDVEQSLPEGDANKGGMCGDNGVGVAFELEPEVDIHNNVLTDGAVNASLEYNSSVSALDAWEDDLMTRPIWKMIMAD